MTLTALSRRFTLPLTLLLSGTLFTVGCSDSPTDSDNDGDNKPQTITAEHYIQAKIDGTYKTVQTENGTTSAVGMGQSAHEGDIDEGYLVAHTTFFAKTSISAGGPVIDTTNTFFITFVGIFDENPFSDEDYDPLIRQGAMSFGSEASEKPGVEIRWIDGNGKGWSTSYGSGDQNGSSFQVTSKQTIEYPQPWLGPYVLYNVKGTFSCTLYDGTGNSISVTDGKFAIQSVLR